MMDRIARWLGYIPVSTYDELVEVATAFRVAHDEYRQASEMAINALMTLEPAWRELTAQTTKRHAVDAQIIKLEDFRK